MILQLLNCKLKVPIKAIDSKFIATASGQLNADKGEVFFQLLFQGLQFTRGTFVGLKKKKEDESLKQKSKVGAY